MQVLMMMVQGGATKVRRKVEQTVAGVAGTSSEAFSGAFSAAFSFSVSISSCARISFARDTERRLRA